MGYGTSNAILILGSNSYLLLVATVYIILHILFIPLITYCRKITCQTQSKYILAAYSFIISTANGLFIEMLIMLPLHYKFQQTAETFLVKRLSEVFMTACALLIT